MQTICFTEDIKNILEDVISSYETRIQSTESLLGPIHQILDTFQTPFLDTKQEQEKVNAELRDNLAKNNSLRRKDFDQMMQGIVLTQDEKEKAARDLLNSYLNEQRQMVRGLRDNLAKVKDALACGQMEKVREFQGIIKEAFLEQEKRKDEVTSKLKELQKEQQEVVIKIKTLLAKGNELRIKDFKAMLREFKLQHKERIAHRKARKEKVRNMLADFKKQRMQWKAAQKKTKAIPRTSGVNIDALKEST